MADWSLYYPYFKAEEFTCKCGCGLNLITDNFISKLFSARMLAGFPFIISSGCRCPDHNFKEGGTKNSDHLFGEGADILCTESGKRYDIIQALFQAGIPRIGISKTFIHAGTYKDNPQHVIWTY
jgi:hypothetical protein